MLRKIRDELETLGLRKPAAALPAACWLFLSLCFAMALAYTVFSDQFGKLGVSLPLPSTLGSIPNFQPKLFPMELFLAAAALLTLSTWKSWKIRKLFHPLGLLVLILLAFGFFRALPDLRENPMLVVRNSAFVWYLSLPVMIALLPIPSRTWETFFRALYLVVFGYFALNLAYPFLAGDLGKIWWSIDLGLLFALAFGLCGSPGWKPKFSLGALGFAIGLSFLSQIQRTTLLGLAGTLAVLALSYFLPVPRPVPRWRRLGWVAVGILVAVGGSSLMKTLERPEAGLATAVLEASPMRLSENLAPGVEKFRFYMWKDAWDLYLSSPMLGVGFLKPVVFRAYAGAGQFLDNEGSFEGRSQFRAEKVTPPISGPHNSYLNALARLGITGISFLVLHLACAWIFAWRGYYACLFVLLWQMFYALFNVSFEGPIRSFPILLLLGAALKAAQEKKQAKGGRE